MKEKKSYIYMCIPVFIYYFGYQLSNLLKKVMYLKQIYTFRMDEFNLSAWIN